MTGSKKKSRKNNAQGKRKISKLEKINIVKERKMCKFFARRETLLIIMKKICMN